MSGFKIALAGNPNCGKTTVFNALTGARQQVGNWPGVTVERVLGEYTFGGDTVEVTDLPGIYSFSALSLDEEVARKHILFDTPDVVVNVVDASNLERNLYLTTQLLEMDVPVVVALNMMDMAKQRGIKIEVEHLSKHIGCPVIPLVASKKNGLELLRAAIAEVGRSRVRPGVRVAYAKDIEDVLQAVEASVVDVARERKVSPRWLAVKLLERDELAEEVLGTDAAQLPAIEEQLKKVERIIGEDADMIIADGRYGFIHGLARDVTAGSGKRRKTFSDAVDKWVLNRVLGIPFFFLVMYLVFVITIQVGGPFIDFFEGLCGTLFVDGLGALMTNLGSPEWLKAIVADGLGGGIQTVATFIPPIFFIFLCLSFLEDSGYMARAAFVMDRFLRTVGLPGKAFIPMLVGFGCNVPGIAATRTLECRRDRILAIMMNPFMSCGARLPVYTLFAAAFFPKQGGVVIFSIYMIGILLAVMTGLLFKNTILRGEVSSFVMELPPYHFPTFSGLLFHTWHRLRSFLIRAGQVILVVVTLLGFLNSLGTDGSFGNNHSKNSVLSAVGRTVTPIFHPMGIEDDNWPATVGLFTGIFAKEAVVGTLASLYAQMEVQEDAVAVDAEVKEPFDFWDGISDAFAAIPEGFGLKTPSQEVEVGPELPMVVKRFGEHGGKAAFAYMLFILIYVPCIAALAAIYREIGLHWMLFATVYLTGLAWIVATMYFQFATFAAHPASSAGWLAVCSGVLMTVYVALWTAGRKRGVKC